MSLQDPGAGPASGTGRRGWSRRALDDVLGGRLVVPAILAILLVWRGLLLLSSVYMGHIEEARQGNLAVLMLEGRGMDLDQARPYGYEGSAVLSALAAVPLYGLLGPSGTLLKICMLAVSMLVLGVLAWLAREEEGPAAAWTVGLLTVFGPTMFVSYGFDSVGGAWWGTGLSSLVLLSALRAFRSRRRAWIPVWAFLVGLCPFVHPTCMVAAAFSLVILALYRWPDLTPRIGSLALLALALGLVPLLAMGLAEDSVLSMIRQAFIEGTYSEGKQRAAESMLGPCAKTLVTFTRDIPHSLAYRVFPWGGYLAYAALGASLAAGVVVHRTDAKSLLDMVRRGRHVEGGVSLATIVMLFSSLYMVLYLVSDITLPMHGRWVFYDKNFKVLFNLLPFVLLFVGLVAGRLVREHPRSRAAVGSVVAVLVILGAASGVQEMMSGRLSLRTRYPSHDMRYLGRNLARGYDIEGAVTRCRELAGSDLPDCLVGVGAQAARHMVPGRAPASAAEELGSLTCEAFDPADRPLCYRGVGWNLNWHGGIGRPVKAHAPCRALSPFDDLCLRGYMEITPDVLFPTPISWLRRDLERRPGVERELLGPGFGVFLANRFFEDPRVVLDQCGRVEDGLGLTGCAPAAARELGWIDAKSWAGGPVPSWLPDALEAPWAEGLGELMAWRLHASPGEVERTCSALAGDVEASCARGASRMGGLMDPAAGAPMLPAQAK